MIQFQLPAYSRNQTLLKRVGCALALGVFLNLLGSCTDDTASIKVAPNTPLPTIPGISQLRIELPPDNFHTLDFMSLHGCPLQITLGKYQSSLGRHASDSQRLLLDLEYLELAPPCIELNRLAANNTLADSLRNIQTTKNQQLPARIYNATLANTEFQRLWQGTRLQGTTPEHARLTLSAINDINTSVKRWLNGDYRAVNLAFEIQLSEVASADITGAQGKKIRDATTKLEALLLTNLPPQYQLWQARRGEYFARLARPTKLD